MSETQKSILSTLVFFDVFDYPMTAAEVWTSLWVDRRLLNDFTDEQRRITNYELRITNELDKLVKIGKIDNKDEFYFLSGREGIVEIRKERYIESLRKIKRAQKMARFLSVLPFIKMVAVCNVLGYLNAKQEDDIDLFIITSKNRIWLARWWSAGFAKLLCLRPRPTKIQDKFCFSFYITEDHLDLQDVALGEDDVYFYYWLTQLIPVYDQGGYFERFVKNNKWVVGKIPQGYNRYKNINIQEYKIRPLLPIIKMIWEKTSLDFDNKLAKKLQMLWLPRKLKCAAQDKKGVIISDDILKFHLSDNRQELSERWRDKISNPYRD